jgi:hypothetical protein
MQVQREWHAQGVTGSMAISGQGWLSKARSDGSRELRVVVGVMPRLTAPSSNQPVSGSGATSGAPGGTSLSSSQPAGSAAAGAQQAANASSTLQPQPPPSEQEQALQLLSVDSLLDFLAVVLMDVLPALDQDMK